MRWKNDFTEDKNYHNLMIICTGSFLKAGIHIFLYSINEISASIKGHNSVENEQKILFNHPNLHLVNINAYTKFDRNPQINSQDIEHKQNSDIDQRP